jgi:hypothetical protein
LTQANPAASTPRKTPGTLRRDAMMPFALQEEGPVAGEVPALAAIPRALRGAQAARARHPSARGRSPGAPLTRQPSSGSARGLWGAARRAARRGSGSSSASAKAGPSAGRRASSARAGSASPAGSILRCPLDGLGSASSCSSAAGAPWLISPTPSGSPLPVSVRAFSGGELSWCSGASNAACSRSESMKALPAQSEARGSLSSMLEANAPGPIAAPAAAGATAAVCGRPAAAARAAAAGRKWARRAGGAILRGLGECFAPPVVAAGHPSDDYYHRCIIINASPFLPVMLAMPYAS